MSASASTRRPSRRAYERGQGMNMAAYGEIDDVIDPADSQALDLDPVRRPFGRLVGARGQEATARRRLVSLVLQTALESDIIPGRPSPGYLGMDLQSSLFFARSRAGIRLELDRI